jgi:hypothetical protein
LREARHIDVEDVAGSARKLEVQMALEEESKVVHSIVDFQEEKVDIEKVAEESRKP